MAATAKKTRPAATGALPARREAEDTYFNKLLAESERRRRNESPEKRLARANKEAYAQFLGRQDELERGVSGRVTRTRNRLRRLDEEQKIYIDYRIQNPRAQAEKVYEHILVTLKDKVSKATLDRDLKALRDAGKIPKYHHTPYIPLK